jgi:hypothetical protein
VTDIFGLSLSEALRWFGIALVASSTFLVAALLLLRRNNWEQPAGTTFMPVLLTPRLLFLHIVSGVVLTLILAMLLRLVFGVQRGITFIFAVVGGPLNMLLGLVWSARWQR